MIYPGMIVYDMVVWDHIVAAIICIFAPLLAYTSRRVITDDIQITPEEKIKLYHNNALLLIVFSLVVVTVWRFPGRSLKGLGFDWPHWNLPIFLLLLAVILFYFLDIFFQYGLRRWREKTFLQRNSTMTFIPSNGMEFAHFLFLALAAGIGEEVIFRGYLMHYLIFWSGNTLSGIIAASLFSSALFAFLHGYQGFKSMLKIFFLALLFSALFILSKSLLLVICIHALIDIVSGWLGIFIQKYWQQEESEKQEN